MKKFFKFRKKNTGVLLSIIICAVLACSLLASFFTMCFGFMTDNYTKDDPSTWFERELNEDNILKRDIYHDELVSESKGGLKLNWKDDGSVIIFGIQESDKDDDDFYRVEFASVTLAPGVYKLSTGNKNADSKSFGIFYSYANSGNIIQNYVGSETETITITESMGDTVVRLSVFVAEDERFFGIQSYVRPILVPEASSVDFYK